MKHPKTVICTVLIAAMVLVFPFLMVKNEGFTDPPPPVTFEGLTEAQLGKLSFDMRERTDDIVAQGGISGITVRMRCDLGEMEEEIKAVRFSSRLKINEVERQITALQGEMARAETYGHSSAKKSVIQGEIDSLLAERDVLYEEMFREMGDIEKTVWEPRVGAFCKKYGIAQPSEVVCISDKCMFTVSEKVSVKILRGILCDGDVVSVDTEDITAEDDGA